MAYWRASDANMPPAPTDPPVLLSPGPAGAAAREEDTAAFLTPAEREEGAASSLTPAAGGDLWGQLAAALKARLSGACYAAWIAPARAVAQDESTRSLTVALPSAFALDRWRRPPIAPALAEAAAALGLAVSLQQGAPPAEQA